MLLNASSKFMVFRGSAQTSQVIFFLRGHKNEQIQDFTLVTLIWVVKISLFSEFKLPLMKKTHL